MSSNPMSCLPGPQNYSVYLFCLGAIPNCIEDLLLALYSKIILDSAQATIRGCQELNLGWQHAKQAFIPLLHSLSSLLKNVF